MPEVNGEKNRYRNRLSARLRGNEPKITRSSHGRRIERRITGAFSHVRRLGNQLAFLVDEHPERHVRLHFLRVQRGRIPERKLLVQHHRQNVRSRPDSGEHITAFCPFAGTQRKERRRLQPLLPWLFIDISGKSTPWPWRRTKRGPIPGKVPRGPSESGRFIFFFPGVPRSLSFQEIFSKPGGGGFFGVPPQTP